MTRLSGALLCSLLLTSCTGGETRPEPVPADTSAARYALHVDVDFAKLEIPNDSRNGVAPPKRMVADGPWSYDGTNGKGMHQYAMPVPIRSRALFFFTPQPGMKLNERIDGSDDLGQEIRYQKGGANTGVVWEHDREQLYVTRADKVPPPKRGYWFTYTKATEREARLNYAFARDTDPDLTQEDFVRTTIQDNWDSRDGLLLPAPATAEFAITPPKGAELSFAPGLVRPELEDLDPSDGASLTVEVVDGGTTTKVWSEALAHDAFALKHVDLSKWADKPITLRFTTDPGGSSVYDYAFIGEPIVAPRETAPQRVVMIFVDTLRPDHLSTYGYRRDTSPALSKLAEESGVVFKNARSIAPWTLPSARTVVTGRQPEFYNSAETVQSVLKKRGWSTAMLAGNVYLSANFNMNKDWDLHTVGYFPSASETTTLATNWLDEHEGKNGLLLIHYMDAHLPYEEPLTYRYMWAGDRPDGLKRDDFRRGDVQKARLTDDADRQHVEDRYDQNIRYIDDQLQKIYSRLTPNDTVVFYSDHGEEFWDHNGFEHGHTLFDELLRVPMVWKVPGVDGNQTIDAPTSLLDVTPTILAATGVPEDEWPKDLGGTNLLPAMKGDAAAIQALNERDQAFGRPLYGSERWGVLKGKTQTKWTTTEGREALYDLGKDPGEKKNLVRSIPHMRRGIDHRNRMGAAMGTVAPVGYRLVVSAVRTAPQTTVTVTAPNGFSHAWYGQDYLDRSNVTVIGPEDEDADGRPDNHANPNTVSFTWAGRKRGTREVYFVPIAADGEYVTHDLSFTVTMGKETKEFSVPSRVSESPGSSRLPIARTKIGQRTVTLTWALGPVPPEGAEDIKAADEEVDAALKAIGYTEDDEPECIDLPKNRDVLAKIDLNADGSEDVLMDVGKGNNAQGLTRAEIYMGCSEGGYVVMPPVKGTAVLQGHGVEFGDDGTEWRTIIGLWNKDGSSKKTYRYDAKKGGYVSR